MAQENTTLFNFEEMDAAETRKTLDEVYSALEERGYNPVNQIVGYLMSGDPGYISSHKEARSKISEFERTKILEMLLEEFLGKK